jgi:hypothetical protein
MRWREVLIGLALWAGMLALSGCAAPPAGEAFRPEIVDPAKGVIYIYRTGKGTRPVTIVINQRAEGALLPGEYMARSVEPGEYFVRAEGQTNAVRQARVVKGDAVYFEVRTGRWSTRPTIEMPDNPSARERIARATRAPEPR